MRILLVEDDPSSRLIARTTLAALGHECTTAADGEAAWRSFSECRPDVVISDWVMPELDGLELCRRIRARAARTYTYFIMLTSEGRPQEIVRGMRAGVDDYLVKPLSADDLEGRLIAAARVTALYAALEEQRDELEHLNAELAALVRRDPLTGLGNRRALEEDLELLEERVARYGHRYCIALIDVDLFKAYNDTYGHQAGDAALKVVAAQLAEQTRGGDAIYRYGGEEFLCVLPEQSLASSARALERMRDAVERQGITHSAHPTGTLTVSAGLAVMDPLRRRPASQVVKDADEALYRAKQLGRNRVEPAQDLVGAYVPSAGQQS